MDPFTSRAVGAAYDAIAEDYARTFSDDLAGLPVDRGVLDAMASRVSPGAAVADLGCGPGQVARYLADHGARVVGVDLAPRMLALARTRTGVPDVMCADHRALPLRTGSLGGAVAFYSLQHVHRSELDAVLAEVRRVLSPGGVFALATHLGEGDLLSDRLLGREVATIGGALYDRADLEDRLAARGFVIERAEERGPLPHEHDTQRIYFLARAAR